MGKRKKFSVNKYMNDKKRSLTYRDWINDTELGLGVRSEKEIINANRMLEKRKEQDREFRKRMRKFRETINEQKHDK